MPVPLRDLPVDIFLLPVLLILHTWFAPAPCYRSSHSRGNRRCRQAACGGSFSDENASPRGVRDAMGVSFC